MSSLPPVRYLDRSTPPHISTLVLLTGLSALAMTVFLPSLPGMTAYFETDYRLMQLSVALYLAVNAVIQVLIGPISDAFGRRPVLLGGLVVFVLATLGCLLSTNVYVFLAFRFLQASIVVGMVLGRAVVRDIVPQDKAASMIGYVTMGTAVVPMIGPAIGGALDQASGWHAVFGMLLAAGVLVTIIAWFDLGETSGASGQSLKKQFQDVPELLASPRFWGYALAVAFSSGAFFAYLGGAPYVGSEVYKLDPAVLGMLFGAPATGYFLGNFISGRYATRFGINTLIQAGAIFGTLGVGLSLVLELLGMSSAPIFFGLMTTVGLANGLVIPNGTSGTLSVRPRLAGTASGLGGAMMTGGGALLSALAGFLLSPGSGATPLLALMFGTCFMSFVAIRFVIWRERQLKSALVE